MAKLLSFTKFDKILKAEQHDIVTPIKYEIDDEVVEIHVKKYIDFNSMMSFVDGVVGAVFFDSDDGETHYVPAILEYAKTLNYIEYFTNLKTEMGSERVFKLMYNTTIHTDILNNISQSQRQHLEVAIDEAVKYRRDVLISGEKAKLADATNKIDQAAQALEALANQFQGIGDDKIKLAFDKFAEIDTNDLVGAVINIRDAE